VKKVIAAATPMSLPSLSLFLHIDRGPLDPMATEFQVVT
jgi:hypothetical protein